MSLLSTPDTAHDRKRLGQYFTGSRLASLLAHLALADRAGSVIDPMAGSGDMLLAAHSAGAVGARFGGIEIDPAAGGRCADRLESLRLAEAYVRIGDAFARETWGSLADRRWELVITNPPYVRYQRSATASHGRVFLPDARRIREGLIDFIERRRLLSPPDRHAMRVLAEGYSGLADLAVPSWLLCASLLGVGGRLAMVVPDTWLSRDYARPVLYLLRRFFDLEVVVEDTHAVWFEDALVRTNLVIARRVEDRGTALDVDTPPYIRVKLEKTTIDDVSMVGALLPDNPNPDRAFAEIVRGLSSGHGARQLDGFSMSLANDDDVRGLLEGVLNSRWLRAVEPTSRTLPRPPSDSSPPVYVPPPVATVLRSSSDGWQSLTSYGWSVGQGLRTGANRFFYGHLLESDESSALLVVDSSISREPLEVPLSVLRPVVRRQEDLDGRFVVGQNTTGRVIALQEHALPEDIAETTALLGACPYKEIPEPLASHVRRASNTDVSSNGRPKLIPTLSAVATNVRRSQIDRPNLPPRFWYQLPEFAPRHAPALLMPRVNHGHPRAFANPQGILVDANFSTLWPQGQTALTRSAVLALLNSTWVSVVLENGATILAGGALKVEATHLRRLPLPILESLHVTELAELGSRLAVASTDGWDDLRKEIDTLVWERVLGSSQKAARAAEKLCELNNSTAAQRGWAHSRPGRPTQR